MEDNQYQGPQLQPDMPSQYGKKIVKNAVSNYVGMAVAIIVTFFLSPFIIHHLGNAAYGLWALFQSLFGYFGLLDLGLSTASVKYIAQYKALNDKKSIDTIVSTLFTTYLVIGTLSLAIALILSLFITRLFNIPPELSLIAREAIIIGGFNSLITFSYGIMNGTLAGYQRYDIINIIGVARYVLYVPAVILLLEAGQGVLFLFYLNLFLAIIVLIFVYYLIVYRLQYATIKFHLFSLTSLKTAFGYSVIVFLNDIAGQIASTVGNVVTGIMLTMADVAFSSLANRLVNYMAMLATNFLGITLPVYSEMDAQGDKERIKKFYLEFVVLSVSVFTPAMMFLVVFHKDFFLLWIGKGYDKAAVLALLLGIGVYIHIPLGYVTGMVLFGLAKHLYLSITNFITMVANILITVICIKRFGVIGIGYSWIITSVTANLLITRYTNKLLHVGLYEYLKTIIPPAFFGIFALLFYYLASHYSPPHHFVILAIDGTIGFVIYMIMFFFFGLSKLQKERYIYILKSFGNKFI